MLVECCKFGKVIRLLAPEGTLFDSLGCIAVTFETIEGAKSCAFSLDGRWFDSRQIETLVFSPTLSTLTPISSTAAATTSTILASESTPISASSLPKTPSIPHLFSSHGLSREDINNSHLLSSSAFTGSDSNSSNSNSMHQTHTNINTVISTDKSSNNSKNENEEKGEEVGAVPDVDDFLNSLL